MYTAVLVKSQSTCWNWGHSDTHTHTHNHNHTHHTHTTQPQSYTHEHIHHIYTHEHTTHTPYSHNHTHTTHTHTHSTQPETHNHTRALRRRCHKPISCSPKHIPHLQFAVQPQLFSVNQNWVAWNYDPRHLNVVTISNCHCQPCNLHFWCKGM